MLHEPTLLPLRPLMLTMDRTDPWTLPSLVMSVWLARERRSRARPQPSHFAR